MLDEAKEQVTSYLLHRESQSGGDDDARALARKIEALAERLEHGGGRATRAKAGRPLRQDRPIGRRGPLGSCWWRRKRKQRRRSETAGKCDASPGGRKDRAIEARLKSIDALKDALVARDHQTPRCADRAAQSQSAAIRQLAELVPQYFNALPQYFTAVQQQVVAAQQHADAGLRAIIDILRPPQTEAAMRRRTRCGPATGRRPCWAANWPTIPALNADRNRLLSGVLSGDPGACGLVGSLLQFRAAAADKMPPLLKDIGEAFYRWQPKTSSKSSELEKALVAWLVRACEQAGMANTIELVSPGERFDSLRHNAPRPGVEITQVLGWIVLRDNGKVYTKASVAVRIQSRSP